MMAGRGRYALEGRFTRRGFGMSLMAPVAGRYAATYSTIAGGQAGTYASLGVAERGFTVDWQSSGQAITNTDAYADAVVDGIYRGCNAFISTVLMEWTERGLAAVTPWAELKHQGVDALEVGIPGRRWCELAGALILTAQAGSSAAGKPATLTALYVMLSEGHNVSLIFGPEHRKIPARWRLLPYNAGYSSPVLFQVT